MVRKVDPALTRRAIGWVKRVRAKGEAAPDGLTDWEQEFLDSVEERLGTYGSAFCDPDKGQLSAPLSLRQGLKVRQIAKGKSRVDVKDEAKSAEGEGNKGPRFRQAPLKRKQGLARTPFSRRGPKSGD